MYIGRERTILDFQNVILLVNVVAFTIAAAPVDLKYTCDHTGVVLEETKSILGHISVASGSSDSLTYCRPSNVNLENCKNAHGQNKNELTLVYEDVTTSGIIGGKKATFKLYKLTCSDAATKVTHKTIVFKAIAEPTENHNQAVAITHDFSLQLKKGSTDATSSADIKLGDTLKLQMTGTDVVITPEKCSAYPSGDSSKPITIWEATGSVGSKQCTNTESAVISTAKWAHVDGETSSIEITLFAFRFPTKAEVVLECSATVCSKNAVTGCTQECVTAALPTAPTVKTTKNATVIGKRKRRSIEIVGKDYSRRIRSSSVSFAVRENEAPDNSSPGLYVGYMYMQFVAFALALLFVS